MRYSFFASLVQGLRFLLEIGYAGALHGFFLVELFDVWFLGGLGS